MTKRFLLIGLLIGIIAGWGVSRLFVPPTLPKPIHSTVAQQEKQVAEKNIIFQQKTDSLLTQAQELAGHLNDTKTALVKARKTNHAIQVQVQNLISQNPVRDTVLLSDTAGCSTLKKEVRNLLTVYAEKDSIQDIYTRIMEQQLDNKQSVIDMQQQLYQSLKSSFNNSLEQQKLLEVQNNQYRKHFKRQKFKQKILSAGTIVLSALALQYVLKL